jgi:release factor glutamine methyltransferase
MPRMQLYLNFERSLDEKELERSRELIKRRGQREPLQQILGSTSFCGLEISVNKDVLVPRPETELLAEQGWSFLRRLTEAHPAQDVSALDFASGSGCIAIALAANCPQVRVTAVELSAEALQLALRNAEALGFTPRIEFLQGGGLSVLDSQRQFDLIISNPPYIPSAEIETLQPEVREFEPRLALDGGADGLAFYRSIAQEAMTFLSSRGKLMLEFGDGQAEALMKIFQEQNWVVEQVVEDYTRRPRILIASSHGKFTD